MLRSFCVVVGVLKSKRKALETLPLGGRDFKYRTERVVCREASFLNVWWLENTVHFLASAASLLLLMEGDLTMGLPGEDEDGGVGGVGGEDDDEGRD